jgi:hypothetical protein
LPPRASLTPTWSWYIVKIQQKKKERGGEREVNKPGRNSHPFCSLLSFHEPNVYFGRNSLPIYKSLEVNELSHSTEQYRRTNEKCVRALHFFVRTGIRTVDLLVWKPTPNHYASADSGFFNVNTIPHIHHTIIRLYIPNGPNLFVKSSKVFDQFLSIKLNVPFHWWLTGTVDESETFGLLSLDATCTNTRINARVFTR